MRAAERASRPRRASAWRSHGRAACRRAPGSARSDHDSISPSRQGRGLEGDRRLRCGERLEPRGLRARPLHAAASGARCPKPGDRPPRARSRACAGRGSRRTRRAARPRAGRASPRATGCAADGRGRRVPRADSAAARRPGASEAPSRLWVCRSDRGGDMQARARGCFRGLPLLLLSRAGAPPSESDAALRAAHPPRSGTHRVRRDRRSRRRRPRRPRHRFLHEAPAESAAQAARPLPARGRLVPGSAGLDGAAARWRRGLRLRPHARAEQTRCSSCDAIV